MGTSTTVRLTGVVIGGLLTAVGAVSTCNICRLPADRIGPLPIQELAVYGPMLFAAGLLMFWMGADAKQSASAAAAMAHRLRTLLAGMVLLGLAGLGCMAPAVWGFLDRQMFLALMVITLGLPGIMLTIAGLAMMAFQRSLRPKGRLEQPASGGAC